MRSLMMSTLLFLLSVTGFVVCRKKKKKKKKIYIYIPSVGDNGTWNATKTK